MDCAPDDDQTIWMVMVNFAISAQFGLIYCKKPLATNPFYSHSLIVELWNFNISYHMVTLLWIVLLMTIKLLWLSWWTSPFPNNLVSYIIKNLILKTYHLTQFLLYSFQTLTQASKWSLHYGSRYGWRSHYFSCHGEQFWSCMCKTVSFYICRL